ncbi:MAG: Na+/H+ antiporter subunit D, partial [Actinobacteria bacterium]|nr:Na+/H+ antiporter subunit D [Actinomycetota bacterium]
MDSALVSLPVVLPLLAGALSLTANRRPGVQRVLGIAVLIVTLGVTTATLARVSDSGILTSEVGGWGAPLGIVLAADLFSGLMLVVSALMLLAVLVYAVGSPTTRDDAPYFHPVYLVLAAGVNASFVTADLFNLFVAFEIML